MIDDDDYGESEQARWERLYGLSAADVLSTFNWFVLKGFPEGASAILTIAAVLDKWLPDCGAARDE
jgi:hypothetical protein